MGARLDPVRRAVEQRCGEAVGVAALARPGRAGEEVGVGGRAQRGLEQALRPRLLRQAGEGAHSLTAARTRSATCSRVPEASTTAIRSGKRRAASAKPSATRVWQ